VYKYGKVTVVIFEVPPFFASTLFSLLLARLPKVMLGA
jgi:hypothetical protein